MIKISSEHLEKHAINHFDKLKNKIDIPDEELKEILLAKPNELLGIAKKYKKYDLKFKNKYDNFITKKKEYNAYNLAENLNVNVCPYCNENPTYTIVKVDGEEILRPEFDHFYDKATYPVLSLSFYNLIPSCHICNSTLKGSEEFSTDTHIHPYQDSFDKEAKFDLKIKDVSFYYDENGFEIPLKEMTNKAEKSAEVFEIEKRYEHHKDIVLELIQKNAIYNESYLDELMTEYEGTLFKNREDLLRMVNGGYVSDEEIGKRPLSKLIKDISKELGLI